MAPERPVRGVPPVHLHVELAEPGVDAEAGLLRRVGVGVVDGHDVLREDDAALQFGGAGVGVAGEVDDSAGGPVMPPVGAGGGFDGGYGVGHGRDPEESVGEPRGEFNLAGVGTQQELVRGGLGQRCAGRPAGVNEVLGGIEGAVEVGEGGAAAGEHGGMGFGVRPVLIVGAEGVGCVGEGDAEFEAAGGDERRGDAGGDFVARGMRRGDDADGDAIDGEGTGENAGPEVEGLGDVFEVGDEDRRAVGVAHLQADAAEAEAIAGWRAGRPRRAWDGWCWRRER